MVGIYRRSLEWSVAILWQIIEKEATSPADIGVIFTFAMRRSGVRSSSSQTNTTGVALPEISGIEAAFQSAIS
jgi:hypothetical protein